MAKQFRTMKDFNNWVRDNLRPSDLMEWLLDLEHPTENEIIAELEAQGYDLDNLLADGHYYRVGNHTNNGWVYDTDYHAESPDFAGEVRPWKESEYAQEMIRQTQAYES